MKITSDLNNIFINKLNPSQGKKYPNLSPLKSDTFSFSGNISRSENPIESENLKNYLNSLGIKLPPNEIWQPTFDAMHKYKKVVTENGEAAKIIEMAQDIDMFSGGYTLEKYILYLAKLHDFSKLLEMVTGESSECKKRGIHFKFENIIDCFPLAKAFMLENNFSLPKDFNRYLQLMKKSTYVSTEGVGNYKYHYLTVPIYTALERKEDLSDYAPLLVYYALEEGNDFTMGDFNPNIVSGFLRKIGFSSEYDVDKKYDYLAPRYNYFEDGDDVINLIEDLKRDYPKKIKFLKELAEKFPDKLAKDEEFCEKIYAKRNNIADFIFSRQNSKDYEEKLPYYTDFLVNFEKLSDKIIKRLPDLDGLKDSRSIYDLMEVLAIAKINIDELIFMAQNSLVINNDLFGCIANKDYAIPRIASVKNISQKEAEKIYLNFANEYNILIEEAENNGNNPDIFNGLLEKDNIIENFTELLDSYGLLDSIDENKGSSALKELLLSLGFGDAFAGKKQIAPAKFVNIIGLLRLFDSKEKISEEYNLTQSKDTTKSDKKVPRKFKKQTKSGKMEASDYKKILQNEKINFDKTKPAIESYLEADSSGFYSDKPVLDIYKIYKSESKILSDTKYHPKDEVLDEESKKQIYSAVKNVLDYYKQGLSFDLNLSRQLDKLIPDRTLLNKFRTRNSITLNANDPERDEEYIKNAVRILSLFEGDMDKYGDVIRYFAKTDFIKLSKNELSEFFETYKEGSVQKDIFSGIANSRAKTLREFNIFAKNYANKEGKINNLITLLNELSCDMDLQTLIQKFLNPLRNFLEEYNLKYEVDNSTLKRIDFKNIKPFAEYRMKEILEIINSISGAKNGKNFISTMPKLTIPKNQQDYFNARNIASEYITYKNGGSANDKIPYVYLKQIFEPETEESVLPFKFSEEKAIIQKQIPAAFVRLINDPSWLEADRNNIFNMTLHAKMRFIERFILPGLDNPEDLYTPATKAKMKAIITNIYNQCRRAPLNAIKTDKQHGYRFSVDLADNPKDIKVNFTGDGTLITLFEVN